MEQPKNSTPIKDELMHNNHLTNNDKMHNNPGCSTVLPSHMTPPSGLTKFIARNPFESDLTNRLHLSVISPTVFSKISSPQHSPEFTWSVDELALIQPAKIEESPIEQIHGIDPEIEIKAQAAINKFFDAQQIVPSPWNTKKNENKIMNVETETPKRLTTDFNLIKDSSKAKKDGSTQTVLSLPVQLPPEVEQALQPYFSFTQEKTTDNDDINCSSSSSSNSSLRRKLFFNHEEGTEDEQTSMLSPEKNSSLITISNSPLQSGMLMYGTPLRKSSHKMQRYHGISLQNLENLSPTNMSPICNVTDKSYENTKFHSGSVTRLNFTHDLSIEMPTTEHMEISQNCSRSGILLNISNIEAEKENVNHNNDFKDTISNEASNMELTTKDTVSFLENDKYVNNANIDEEPCNFTNKVRVLSDICQTNKTENYTSQQSTTFFGISERQSISGIVQDTGYETYSMNNTTNITDNSPLKQKISNHGLISDEEIRLFEWKGNLRNVVCSTPSKHNRKTK